MDFFYYGRLLYLVHFSILIMVLCIFEHFELISIFAIYISVLYTVNNFGTLCYLAPPTPRSDSGSAAKRQSPWTLATTRRPFR